MPDEKVETTKPTEYDRAVAVAVTLTELINALVRSGHVDGAELANRLKDYELMMLKGTGGGGKLMSAIRTSISKSPNDDEEQE
jgi:hypothetical protein